MVEIPDPDWYLEHVLDRALPGRSQLVDLGAAAAWREWWQARTTSDDPLVVLAARQGFVLTTAQLHAAGIIRSTVRTRVRRGIWTSPRAGTVAPLDVRAGTDDRWLIARRLHALHAAATALCRPEYVVSACSAAVLRGLPTVTVPRTAQLTAPGRSGLGASSSCHSFGAALDERAVQLWFGVRVTDCARTVVDVARHDRRDGILAADAALHERFVTKAALEEALDSAVGWPGVRQAREIAAFASPLAESPLESLVRLALHDVGLPPPQLQMSIAGYRVDLCWPTKRLIVEVDGLGKYTTSGFAAEKRREHALRRYGYRVERVTWDDLTRHWPATVAWLRAALA